MQKKQPVDAKVLNATFEKLQGWLQGEPNPAIDEWLEDDFESYEKFAWLYSECARLGWTDPSTPMLKYADDEVKLVAEQLWRSAMAYAERDDN